MGEPYRITFEKKEEKTSCPIRVRLALIETAEMTITVGSLDVRWIIRGQKGPREQLTDGWNNLAEKDVYCIPF